MRKKYEKYELDAAYLDAITQVETLHLAIVGRDPFPQAANCYRARWMREKRARMSALGDGEGSSGQGKPITETGKARQVG